jgi:hypothetical protein
MRPDVRETLHRAAAAPDAPPDLDRLWARGRRHAAGRRLAAPLVVLVLVASALALVRPTADAPPAPPPPPASIDFDRLPTGWTMLRPPPPVMEYESVAWTGRRLLVWAHMGQPFTRPAGFAYNPGTRTWTQTSLFPLSNRRAATWQWTGREMIVWGGQTGVRRHADGAAYDPLVDRWRTLPPAPIEGRSAASVWTGREMIVWGDRDLSMPGPAVDGAAFKPATQSWRRIADAPEGLLAMAAVWTGREMLVIGVPREPPADVETGRLVGLAYSPDANTWRRLPDRGLDARQVTLVWSGTEVITIVYDGSAAAYNPDRDTWRSLPPTERFGNCAEQSAAVSGRAFVARCVAQASSDTVGVSMYDPDAERWTDVTPPGATVSSGRLVAADPVVLLVGRAAGTGESIVLAYRPPE